MNQFIKELSQRNVFRVALVYGVVTWVLIQVSDIVFPAIGLPEWSITLIIAFLAVGFPIALIFAWAFEITPEGIKREKDVDRSRAITSGTGRKLDYITIAAVVVGIAFLAWDRLAGDRAQQAPPTPMETALALGIAVLPFENLSADASNAFFAGGVHEEVLTHLSRIADLRVISRTSMLRIAETDLDVRAIGERLGVSHVLEGSVRRAGDRVRVTVQLIDAAADQHLWSESYDRTLTDIFAIQSDIALAIAGQLRAELSPETVARIEEIPTDNTEAYDLYLQAMQERRVWRGADTFQAMKPLLEQAVALDPDFLRAQVALAETYGRLLWTGADPDRVYGAKTLELVTDIRRRWPDRIEGRLALGHYYYTVERDYERALAEYQAVAEVVPNDVETLGQLASSLKRLDRDEEWLRYARQWVELDPESSSAAGELVMALENNGLIDEALALAEASIERFPEDQGWRPTLATQRLELLGDVDAYLAEGERLRGDGRWAELGGGPDHLTWLLYDRGDLEAALARIEFLKGETYGWQSIGPDVSLAWILRFEGRDDEAQIAANRARDFVKAWIEADRPFPNINTRFWYTYAALAAAIAGDSETLADYRVRAAAEPAGELLVQQDTAFINAYTDAVMGDAEAGWARIAPYAGDPGVLTAEFAAVSGLQYLFGDVPAFQAFIAEAEVLE